jgi:arsenate reductase (thioredoxin)
MDEQLTKKRVLFLSKHNSTRSQMAEALLRDFAEGKFDVFSAGTHITELNDLAVKSLQEVGIDISHYRCKPVGFFADQSFDYVVTLCATATEECPAFPKAQQSFIWDFANPIQSGGSEEEKLRALRDFRDALSQKIQTELIPLV